MINIFGNSDKLSNSIKNIATEQATPKTGNVKISEIIVSAQLRKEFEDDENVLQDLADDIKKRGVHQPLLVRPIQGGKYELVAGERRLRASKMAGLTEVPVFVKTLSDQEKREAQYVENEHRKQLTLQEKAAFIQEDLDQGLSIDDVLKKYNQSRGGKAWVSKMTSLLRLSDQAKRLLDEDISGDLEVINDIRQIERKDPEKAKEVVDTLRAAKESGEVRGQARKITREARRGNQPSNESKPVNKDAQQPSPASVFPPQANETSVSEDSSFSLPASHDTPSWIIDALEGKNLSLEDEKKYKMLQDQVQRYFELGKNTDENWVNSVLLGLEKLYFNNTFYGRLNLAAFSTGFEKASSLDLKKLIELINKK